MKPKNAKKRKPIVRWIIVCVPGEFYHGWSYNAREQAELQEKMMLCGPHRIVKLMEARS